MPNTKTSILERLSFTPGKYWQLLIFPALYYPCRFLNSEVIVKWLGCGCPQLDAQGNLVKNTFNANAFTLAFWLVIALVVIAISLYNMRSFTKWYHKLIYISLISAGSVFIAYRFYSALMWC